MRNLSIDEFMIATKKIAQMGTSCKTLYQRKAFNRYRQLFKESLERYQNDFGYQMKVDFSLLLIIGSVCAGIIVLSLAFGLNKILGY